jgi:CubicO group peptidase (beta-lactamase class C family)
LIDEPSAPKDSARLNCHDIKNGSSEQHLDSKELGCKTTMPFDITPAFVAAGHSVRFAPAYGVLTEAIAAHAFPGCAFGMIAEGEIVLQDALGRFTYEEDAPAVGTETVYDVASITKVASTTAAAMLLYQRGRLDLDTPLGELLPGFVAGRGTGDCARHVKLRHLLAHNSGLPGYVQFFRTAATPAELFRACLVLPLEAEPGTRAEYSDPGFILLGKALEELIGEDLPSWVRSEVYEPLGLASSGFCPPRALRSSIPPTEEDTTFRKRRIQGEVQDENAWVLGGAAGHAGLFSNVPDLLRFAQEMIEAGWTAGKPLLFAPETVSLFAQRQGPEGSSRALGWDTPSQNSSSGSHFSLRSIGHLGFSGCSLWIDLENRVAVTLLTNRTWPGRQCALIRKVRPAFHNAVRQAL